MDLMTNPVMDLEEIPADLQEKLWGFPATRHLQDINDVEKDDECIAKAATMTMMIFSEFSEDIQVFGGFGETFLVKTLKFDEELSKKIVAKIRVLNQKLQPPSSTVNAPQDQATSSTKTEFDVDWLGLLENFRANRDSWPWIQEFMEYPNPSPQQVELKKNESKTLGESKSGKRQHVEERKEVARMITFRILAGPDSQGNILIGHIEPAHENQAGDEQAVNADQLDGVPDSDEGESSAGQ